MTVAGDQRHAVAMRHPSSLGSNSQPGPKGNVLASFGMQGSMNVEMLRVTSSALPGLRLGRKLARLGDMGVAMGEIDRKRVAAVRVLEAMGHRFDGTIGRHRSILHRRQRPIGSMRS